MKGRCPAAAVCWFLGVRANSKKPPECGLGAQPATAKQHLEAGKPVRGAVSRIF